jgi:hypothetical protein
MQQKLKPKHSVERDDIIKKPKFPPGIYEVVVSFPNGATQVIDSFEIARGTAHELNFSYNA